MLAAHGAKTPIRVCLVMCHRISILILCTQSRLEPRLFWGAEIQSYCEKIAADYGVTAHCHFGVTVSKAQYKDGQWHLSFAQATAPDIQKQFDVVVTAIGGLHTPAFPDIAGREDFQGADFHTAQWNHDIDLTGKKVIIIGSAASAVQVVPQIADQLGTLKVFQRTPNWMFPRINNKISGFAKSLMRAIPALSWIRRQLIYWRTEYLFHPAFKENSFMQKYMRRLAVKYLKATVKDEDLRKNSHLISRWAANAFYLLKDI